MKALLFTSIILLFGHLSQAGIVSSSSGSSSRPSLGEIAVESLTTKSAEEITLAIDDLSYAFQFIDKIYEATTGKGGNIIDDLPSNQILEGMSHGQILKTTLEANNSPRGLLTINLGENKTATFRRDEFSCRRNSCNLAFTITVRSNEQPGALGLYEIWFTVNNVDGSPIITPQSAG